MILVKVSAIISALLLVILLGLGCVFVYLYGRQNPGGLSERIAMRLEANYKRFGGSVDDDRVQLEHSKNESSQNNNNNDNDDNHGGSISVSF